MEFLLILFAIVFVFGGLGYAVFRLIRRVLSRGGELQQLVHKGVSVTGRVQKLEKIRRNRAGHHDYFVTYQFQDVNGQEHVKRKPALWEEHDALTEGACVDIVYLRDQPQISATRAVVEQMRHAQSQMRENHS